MRTRRSPYILYLHPWKHGLHGGGESDTNCPTGISQTQVSGAHSHTPSIVHLVRKHCSHIDFKSPAGLFLNSPCICQRLLDLTATLVPICLSWTKAHVGNSGKGWLKDPKTGRTVPIWSYSNISFVKSRIKDAVSDKWSQYWESLDSCRQTKLWFPRPDPVKSKFILKLDRLFIVRWYMGHNFSHRHQHLLIPDVFQTNLCRLCFQGVESAEYLIIECHTLEHSRNYCLLFNQLVSQYEPQPQHLADFIKEELDCQ